ncbi:urate hydroxylase PuuD [Aquirhabdus parva]|uniref:Urate oxidase N-terminal domain-containing protein n=1 Tax=Aquirhabdus parva TaxID=2283318 RepID=A0A345P893_9GAMM|nr:urate hydroxylase PuuD [Aquirhabdus parva]AXI03502.1 hypothetical protein HYN46_12025 [Aquirhabdus parva]
MSAYLLDWLNLLVRFIHVITAIAWIGASFYFVWLDNSLAEPPQEKKDKGIKGDLWAIHGGGFYEVAKYQLAPPEMPKHLHWFKWEAYSTWLSGFLLLSLMYFFGATTYLIDPSKVAFTPKVGVAVALAAIFGSWLIYDALCRTNFARTQGKAFAALLIVLIGLLSFTLNHIFSGRAAYLLVGVSIGTCMVFNVWRVIMPAQTKLVEAVRFNKTPNPAYAQAAKLRSLHNNYGTLPIVFLMLSNHYPMTYGNAHAWLVLVILVLLGMWVRHFFNLRHHGKIHPPILISGFIAFFALAFILKPPMPEAPKPVKRVPRISTPVTEGLSQNTTPTSSVAPTVTNAVQAPSGDINMQAQSIIKERCAVCHSKTPTDPTFTTAPMGVMLDNEAQMKQWAARIRANAVDSHTMPFMNKTGMTDAEREQLRTWLDSSTNKQ